MRRTWWWLLAVCAALAADGPQLGSDAPRFTLNDLSGTARRLVDQKDHAKAIVLVWVSTTCRSGVAYQSRIQDLYQEFRGRDVVVYGISSNHSETVDAIRDYMHAHELTYPVLKDPHNKVADAYGAVCNAEVYILDGKLKLRYHGAFDNSVDPDRVDPTKRYARKAVQALLAGRAPDPAETTFRGCAIERE